MFKKNDKSYMQQKGFTLVELSVVLIIISLIVGGIFKAAELVENSRVDRLINDLQAFQVSYYSYYDRVGDFPGNGSNSNRYIEYDATTLVDGSFFQELFNEGFIKTPVPSSALVAPGYYFATYLAANGSVDSTTGTILGKNQACVTFLAKKHARHLDNELDDGVWNTGRVRTTADFDDLEEHTLCLEI